MKVRELYELNRWVLNQLSENLILEKYSQLHTKLTQNAQPNAAKQPFEEETQALTEALNEINLSELSISQLEVLDEFEIVGYLGKNGAEFIKDTLYKNVIDIATSRDEIGNAKDNINSAIEWAREANEHLEKIILDTEIQLDKDEVLLRIHFQNEAQIGNISELKKWGEIWYDIGRGIAMAHDEPPEEIEVVGANNGSIIIELATVATIASTISFILIEILKVFDKYFDIRKKAEEIKTLKLSNTKIEAELIAEADKHKNEAINKLIKNLHSKLKFKKSGDGEKSNALNKSVQKLADFIEKGGLVDVVVADKVDSQDDESENNNLDELRDMATKVRMLEKKVYQLEHKEDE